MAVAGERVRARESGVSSARWCPVLLLCAASLSSGCATIMEGGDEDVMIESRPSGADFVVRNESGEIVARGETPATVNLERGDAWFDGEEYTVECTVDGHKGTQVLETELSDYYTGNLVFGLASVIGFLTVDPATGAMWQFERDRVLVVIPEPPAVEAPHVAEAPREDARPTEELEEAAKADPTPTTMTKDDRIRAELALLRRGEISTGEFERRKNRILEEE